MDDLTVTTTSVPGCRWILNGLQELMSWDHMNFKPAKSRSLVLKKGKVTDKFHFSLGTTKIPSLTQEPVKSLGKVFNCSLRDTASTKATNQDLKTWLAVVWPSWQVQGLDLPARHPPSDPLAPPGV